VAPTVKTPARKKAASPKQPSSPKQPAGPKKTASRKKKPAAQRLRIRPTDLPRGLTEAKVRRHVILPKHVRNVRIEEVDPAKEIRLDLEIVPKKKLPPTPKADLEKFANAIHQALKDSVTGYMLQVGQNGTLAWEGIWNWAQTPSDAGLGWNRDRRMHVASVSKFLTAVGMVKALDSKGISYDAKIKSYLPSYWTIGPKVDQITFRHLLTHNSGFSTGGSSTDYLFMKGRVADGVPAVGSSDYENMNFGLCRILIPVVMGKIDRGLRFPLIEDLIWDALTIGHYRDYMQDKVFTPAGVSAAGFVPPSGGTFAYQAPPSNANGWNSGDLASVSGGAGWRLSCKELLDVMHHVRRKNTIVSKEKAQEILDSGFGIDQIIDTPAGKTYNKNGAWGTGDNKTEQCVAYFLPADMEAVLFVNSPIGAQGASLRGLVQDAYVACLS
jgi:CubicO group peptidase (beta-lactamase class C family)